MRVVSVTPIDDIAAKSLMENGSFETWVTGAPTPTGFFGVPKSSGGHSTVKRSATAVAEGEQALFQEWSGSDWGDPIESLFGVLVEDLKGQTNYRFRIQSNVQGKSSGYVEAYHWGTGAARLPIGEIVLRPMPGYTPYELIINTGRFNALRFVSRGPEDPNAYPNSILFDDWSLEETQDSPVKPERLQTSGAIIPNGSLAVWNTGVPLPGHPFYASTGASSISRVSAGAGERPYALRQRWTRTNSIWDSDKLFNLHVKLKQGTRYQLSVKANTLGKYSAYVDVYGVDKANQWIPLAGILLRPAPAEGWKDYTGTFDTEELSDIRITTNCFKFPEGASINEVHWDDWNLEELGPSPERIIPPDAAGSLIANGSFEDWILGRPKPEGPFSAPSTSPQSSTITPSIRTASDGRIALSQAWTSKDNADNPESLFGVELSGLKARTRYTFSCSAYHFAAQVHTIRFFAVRSDGRLMALTRMAVGEKQTYYQWEDYTFTVDMRSYTRLWIVSLGPESSNAYPFRVLWDNWRLVEENN